MDLLVIVTSIGAILMAIFAMFIRMKAAKKPASAKKILLPPVFMSTGALMYIFPEFRLSFMEIIESVIIGMLFSILLIKTSKFEIKGRGDLFKTISCIYDYFNRIIDCTNSRKMDFKCND